MHLQILRFFYSISIPGLWCLHSVFACEVFISQYEKQHGIPEKLLSAIALTESGRRVEGGRVAWPWTINANGVPYVLETKAEAVAKVKLLQSQGVRSIDVGCMQINLLHHPDAFQSLESAFDPETNIAYAANFLKQKMAAQGSWKHAVAHYHSATKTLNEPYKNKVLETWDKIQDQPDLVNAVFSTQMAPKIVRVPLAGLGQRTAPINVRFNPFAQQNLKGAKKPSAKEGPSPNIHSLENSSRSNLKPKFAIKERRIPLHVFAATEGNQFSLHRSSRFRR